MFSAVMARFLYFKYNVKRYVSQKENEKCDSDFTYWIDVNVKTIIGLRRTSAN